MSSVSPSTAEIAAFLYPEIPDEPECILGVQMRQDHCHKLRAILIIDLIGRVLLEKIFGWGAPLKCIFQTLREYLVSVKGMADGQYRNMCTKTSDDILDEDEDSSRSSFDVSLWYAAIQCGCEDLAWDNTSISSPDTLENHLKRIKDFRKEVMHGNVSISEKEFKDKCEELRHHFFSTLDKAQDKYSIDLLEVDQLKEDINSSIDYLRDTPLSHMDLPVDVNLCTVLREFAVEDLLKIFEKMSYVNPAQMIVGSNIFLEAKSIYSELCIRSAEQSGSDEVIAHNDLLKHANEKKKYESGVSHIFLIEGDAGAGKTTLIKFLVSDWKKVNTLVKELSHFKCVINVQCRSHEYDSFLHLIGDQMPTVRACFREGIHMKKWIADQPSLIILDGLDEMNNKSRNLFDEIIKLSHDSKVQVLCTSRPHEIDNYYCIVPEHIKTVHVKIEGIPETSREMFVRNIHDELKYKGFSQRSTNDLVCFVKSIEEHVMDFLKLPLHLTLLTVLWIFDPDRVNSLTNVTDLYNVLHELIVNRLYQRLLQYKEVLQIFEMEEVTGCTEFKTYIKPFVKAIGSVALKGLRDDVLFLEENVLKDVKDVCKSLKLPASELLDAFLIKENNWGKAKTISSSSSFYHKSNQEYYAGYCIYMESEENPQKSITNIFEELQITYFTNYQNVLISLIGLHYYFECDVESVVTELITLLQKSEMNSVSEWVNVLSMTKNNEKVAQQMCRGSSGILEGIFEIRDGNLSTYMTLLKLHRPKKVTINISGKPMELANLEECLDTLSSYQCKVEELVLWYPFLHPAESCVGRLLDDKVIHVLQRCGVTFYGGNMTSIPPTLSILWVSVRDESEWQQLNTYLQSNPRELEFLNVCVPVGIDPTCLSPLSFDRPCLSISGVTDNDIEKAAELAGMIQPIHWFLKCLNFRSSFFRKKKKKKFGVIFLPRTTMKEGQQKQMINMLKTKCVKVDISLCFPFSLRPSSEEGRQEVIDLGQKELGCSFIDWIGWLDD